MARLSDFTDNAETIRVARILGSELFGYRATSQRIALDRVTAETFDPESLPDVVPLDDVPPHGLDAIYGSGIARRGGDTVPVVLVDERTVGFRSEPGELLPLAESRGTAHVVEALLSGSLQPNLAMFAIPAPTPHYGPGQRADAPAKVGTFGAVFTDPNERDLITTAGHVASVGATVTDSSGATGTVVWSHDPAVTRSPTPAVDLALISADSGAFDAGTVAIAGPGIAQLGDAVEVHGAMTPLGQTQVFIVAIPGIYLPQMAGKWAQSYITTTAASQPGDSGAPVFLAGTSTLIGHVVGGAPGLLSYIQTIDVQLQATGCHL